MVRPLVDRNVTPWLVANSVKQNCGRRNSFAELFVRMVSNRIGATDVKVRNYSHQKKNLRGEHQFINQIQDFHGKEFEFKEKLKRWLRFSGCFTVIDRAMSIAAAVVHGPMLVLTE